MPVTDFECQIARGQIGRYLGGGMLSPQAMSGLEEHLSECPGCKALVAERRAALLGQLGGEMPVKAVVSMPVREENPLVAAVRSRAEALKAEGQLNAEENKIAREAAPKTKASPRYAKTKPASKAPGKTPPAPGKPKPVMTKPLVLGALLAVVLIGMSYLTHSNGGKGALGGRAFEAFASTEPAAKSPAPSPSGPPDGGKPAVAPDASKIVATDSLADKPKETASTQSEKPLVAAKTEGDAILADHPAKDPVNPDSTETAKLEPTKSESPKPESLKSEPSKTESIKSDSKHVVSVPKPEPSVKAAVTKVAVKPATPKSKPSHRSVKRMARKPAARKHVVARKPRRIKRKAGNTVRIYGLDGHPLKS